MDESADRSLRRRVLAMFRSRATWLVGGTAVLALVPRFLTAGRFTTIDEPKWMERSARFADALGSGHLADASATAAPGPGGDATMPGVTTMWIGSLARGVWAVGRSWGMWSNDQVGFTESLAGLAIAQAAMSIVTSALIGLVAFLVFRWAGWEAAIVAGVLLATEPFLVAYGAVLHTDALMTLFGLASLVATALALGLPRPTLWTGRWWASVLAGALWGGSLLTKMSALPLLLSVSGMGAWALVRAWRERRAPQLDDGDASADGLRRLTSGDIARVGACWAASALVVVWIAYPALWVQPLHEVDYLWRSARLASRGHHQFFLGERTRTPGPLYYFVVLPLRITPWFFVAGVVTSLGIWWRRTTRGFGLTLLVMVLPTLIAVSLASKQFNRYGLPIVAVGAVAVGVMASTLLAAISASREPRRRLFRASGLVAAGLVVLHTVAVAPWGNVYYNPLLGGASTAERAFTIGGGEGLERAGAIIEDRERHRCDEILVWTYQIENAYPCGAVASGGQRRKLSPTAFDYVVVYVNQRQRSDPEYLAGLAKDREVIDVVTARGIVLAEIFGPVTG